MGLIPWGDFYKFGSVAGFTPAQVKEMSLWEFNAVVEGKTKANEAANGGGEVKAPTEDEFFAAIEASLD